jgi:hypothetical protein
MSSLSVRRAVLAALLGWVLLISPASASQPRSHANAPRTGKPATQETQGTFQRLWEVLGRVFLKNGGSADPNGLLGSQVPTNGVTAFCDAGGSLDPDGRCLGSH